MLVPWLEQQIPPHYGDLRRRLRRILSPAWLGTLRRTTPLSNGWGFDRGQPLDRYYLEQFLTQQCADICGDVLEVKDNTYTRRYGAALARCTVLDVDATNPQATLIADLAQADALPGDQFDCFILTQTLQLIYDVKSAVAHAHRLLRPRGVLLVTVPCVSRVIADSGLETDYWRFTRASCQQLFGTVFGAEQVTVQNYGNVLTCMAFLTGLAREDLQPAELNTHDADFPLLLAVRAVKK